METAPGHERDLESALHRLGRRDDDVVGLSSAREPQNTRPLLHAHDVSARPEPPQMYLTLPWWVPYQRIRLQPPKSERLGAQQRPALGENTTAAAAAAATTGGEVERRGRVVAVVEVVVEALVFGLELVVVRVGLHGERVVLLGLLGPLGQRQQVRGVARQQVGPRRINPQRLLPQIIQFRRTRTTARARTGAVPGIGDRPTDRSDERDGGSASCRIPPPSASWPWLSKQINK